MFTVCYAERTLTRYAFLRLNRDIVSANIVALKKPQHVLAKLIRFFVRLS